MGALGTHKRGVPYVFNSRDPEDTIKIHIIAERTYKQRILSKIIQKSDIQDLALRDGYSDSKIPIFAIDLEKQGEWANSDQSEWF